MNNEDKMYDLMTKMYGEMQKGFEDVYKEMRKGFEEVNKRFEAVTERMDKFESELHEVKNTVVRIENDHGKKLSALFDGYKQNSDKLDRIETEVSKHEEIILRRVR